MVPLSNFKISIYLLNAGINSIHLIYNIYSGEYGNNKRDHKVKVDRPFTAHQNLAWFGNAVCRKVVTVASRLF